MKPVMYCSLGLVAMLAVAGGVEHFTYQAKAERSMGVVDTDKVAMQPAPIRRDWVIEGNPTTQAAEVARSHDGTTQVFVWSTTKSRFHWNYESDEIITVLDGDVFISDGDKPERHLGPGDAAFFPAGAETTWRVPDHLRKLATLKKPLPSPIASVMRWMRTAKNWVKPTAAFAAD